MVNLLLSLSEISTQSCWNILKSHLLFKNSVRGISLVLAEGVVCWLLACICGN